MNVSNNQPNLTTKAIREREKTCKTQSQFWGKEIIENRTEKKSMKTIVRINNTKRGLQESIKKIMSQTHQQNRENIQINKVRHEKGDVISDATEISKDHKRLQQTSLSQ